MGLFGPMLTTPFFPQKPYGFLRDFTSLQKFPMTPSHGRLSQGKNDGLSLTLEGGGLECRSGVSLELKPRLTPVHTPPVSQGLMGILDSLFFPLRVVTNDIIQV